MYILWIYKRVDTVEYFFTLNINLSLREKNVCIEINAFFYTYYTHTYSRAYINTSNRISRQLPFAIACVIVALHMRNLSYSSCINKFISENDYRVHSRNRICKSLWLSRKIETIVRLINEKKGKRMKNSVDVFKSVKMMHHYISRHFINFET